MLRCMITNVLQNGEAININGASALFGVVKSHVVLQRGMIVVDLLTNNPP